MLNTLSDLDLRLIRVFMAVVEAGGVSAAQASLNVSQSTISNQLAALETRLGYRLCERGRAGFALTARGERFLAACRELLDAVESFCAGSRRLENKLVGQLRVGVVGHTTLRGSERLSDAIRRFRQRNEEVELIITMLPPGMLEEALINGQLHLGIGYFWHRSANLDYRLLLRERQLAYCAAGHPLFAEAGAVGLAAAERYDWAWRTYPLPAIGLPYERWRVTARADNMEAMAALVLSGCHLGFLPEHFARPLAAEGLLRPLNETLLCYQPEIHLVTRKGAAGRDSIAAFIDDLTAAHAGAAAQD